MLKRLALIVIAAFAARFPFAMVYKHRPLLTGDDLMNLYFAWIMPVRELITANLFFWPNGRRPMGGLFYLLVFNVFGLRSRPLYYAVWFFIFLNLWLAWGLYRKLGASKPAATLATLILAAQPCLFDLSYNAGTLYDTLCFTFTALAFRVYLDARGADAPAFSWRRLAGFGFLLVLAMNSKEMAVTLAVMLFVWELLFRSLPRDFGWITRPGRGLVLAIVLTGIFTYMTAIVPGPLAGMAAYTPVFTLTRLVETTTTHLGLLFMQDAPLPAGLTLIFYVFLFLAAAALRSKLAAFSFLWFVLTQIPIAFATPRHSGYVLYIPLMLFGLGVATLLDRIQRPVVVFVTLSAALAYAAVLTWKEPLGWTAEDEAVRLLPPTLQCAAKPRTVYFVNDPFDDSFGLHFVVHLLCRDNEILILRQKQKSVPLPKPLPPLDRIWSYDANHYIELDRTNPARSIEFRLPVGQTLHDEVNLSSPNASSYFVKDILFPAAGGRWTGAEPTVRFELPDPPGARRLKIHLGIAADTLKQNGPKEIEFLVNGTRLAVRTYDSEGSHEFETDVQPQHLHPGLNTVTVRVRNPYVSPLDQAVLGVILDSVALSGKNPE